MTDEELSLKIAEFLEPSALLPQLSMTRFSPLGCWETKSELESWTDEKHFDKPSREFIYVRRPRNMVTDPSMTVMLMERSDFIEVMLLAELDAADGENGYVADFCTRNVHDVMCMDSGKANNKKLGRAIAEAFARAKGLL